MADAQDQGLVQLVNEMLRQLHINHKVKNWLDINAEVFVTMFEGLSGESLSGLITHPKTRADEAHNMQLVINAISSDILNTSLSHITGEEVVNGNKAAITNLLEIFSGLLEFILDKISSETSSQKDLSEVEEYEQDPDKVRGDLIEDILNEELSKGFADTAWRKDDEEGLNLRLESSSPWWSDENDQHEKFDASSETICRTGRGLNHRQTENRRMCEVQVMAGRSNARHGNRTGHAEDDRSRRSTRRDKDNLNSTEDYIALGYQSNSASVSSGEDNTEELIGLGSSLREELAACDVNGVFGRSDPGPTNQEKASNGKGNAPSTAPAGFDFPMPATSDRLMTSTLGSSISGLTVPMRLPGATTEYDDVGIRPTNLDRRPGQEKFANQQRSDSAAITHHLHHYHHYGKDNTPTLISSRSQGFSRSHPGSGQGNLPATNTASSLPLPSSSQKSRSYEDLAKVVEDTVNISREAVSGNVSNKVRQDRSGLRQADLSKDFGVVIDHHQNETSLRATDIKSVYNSMRKQGNMTTTGREKHTVEDILQLTDLEMPARSKNTNSMLSMGQRENRKVSFLTSAASEINGSQSERDQARDSSHAKQSNITRDRGTSPIKSLSSSKTQQGQFKKTVSSSSQARENSLAKRITSPRRSVLDKKSSVRTQKLADQLAPPRQQDSDAHQYDHLDHPKTFREYLDKYYGTVERRDMRVRNFSEDEDLSQHSDSAVDYTPEADKRADSDHGDVSDSDETFYQPPKLKLPKSVRFDDICDNKATGAFADIRRSLKSEDDKARAKKGILDKLYSFELKNFQDDAKDAMKTMSKTAKGKEADYRKKMFSKPGTSKYASGRSYRGPGVLLKRSPTRARSKVSKARRRSASASPSIGRRKTVSSEGDLLPLLLEEFPFLHLSAETLHDLWRKSTRQLSQLSKAEMDVRRRKSTAQLQIEEAERRQEILTQIMKKELMHNERMKELKERQQQQQSVKSKVRDKRTQSARGRRYYEEYQIRHRSRMLKKKTKEELLFKKLFQDCLEIQKERIREMRKYAKDQRSDRASKQQLELESLENYYRDQFEMLADALAQERSNIQIREKAQTKVLNDMKRQLKEKMEREIENFQEQMYRDEDDEYFRQLDADRLRHQVNMANYLARV